VRLLLMGLFVCNDEGEALKVKQHL